MGADNLRGSKYNLVSGSNIQARITAS